MATVGATSTQIQFPPPLKMSGNASSNWKTFKSMWNNYEKATGLSGNESDVRTATFLSCIGIEGFELYETLDFATEADRQKIDKVLERLDQHFIGEINETFERFKFNQRNQELGESIDTYVSSLRALVKSCNFSTLEESLLRDRIVLGIRDDGTRKKLLQTRNLDLKLAIDTCRASEISAKQVSEMKPSDDVNKLTRNMQKLEINENDSKHHRSQYSSQKTGQVFKKCKFCGLEHKFQKELCPAWGQICRKCHKKNHYSSVCKQWRSENVKFTDTQLTDEEEILVLRRQQERDFPKRLYAKLELAGKLFPFQIDSGASVNVLPEDVFRNLPGRHILQPPPSTLFMYDKSELQTSGIFATEVRNPKTGRIYTLDFYVVPGHKQPILGAAASQLLKLIKIQKENIFATDSLHCRPGRISKQDVLKEFVDIFSGYGKIDGLVHLEVDDKITPVRMPLRKLPIAVRDKVKLELERMMAAGIISPVAEPTEWISALLVVMKPDGRVRICIDPKPLNVALKRNHYPLPVMDDFLPELQSAKIFSTVDAKDGFWHVCLDTESSLLTTFETPFGKFKWNRLPFGLSVSPEEFQRRLNEALSGLAGIAIVADDVLIYGRGETIEEATLDHDKNLLALLDRCRQKGIKLNANKLKLHLRSVSYMGHCLTDSGLQPDDRKIMAIKRMPAPKDKQGVQRLLGMVNYLAKFIPNLSEITTPLRSLLHSDAEWVWDPAIQGAAFEKIKQLLLSAPVLKYFDAQKPIVIQGDSSQSGLGACLMQEGAPIAYASRSLTETEQQYAQIEKETLAIVFAMEKFHMYVYGHDHVTVETDHKPLLAIFKKALNNAPKRLQRMLLRLQRYQFVLTFRPGSDVVVADALSRAYPATGPRSASQTFTEEVALVGELTQFEQEMQQFNSINLVVASDSLKNTLIGASKQDPVIRDIQQVIQNGWPESSAELSDELQSFFSFRDELVMEDNLLYKGGRLYVPAGVRDEILKRIHSSHIGVQGCIRRARESVFWPGMAKDISRTVSSCQICAKCQVEQAKEPLMPHDIPNRPWQQVACDLFEFNQVDYLITVDYYSNFFEVDRLNDKKATEVIRHLKNSFARHGLPDYVISDNGPPFQSAEFKSFATAYEFVHKTSSPRYAQSNGKAENAVRTVKNLMRKAAEDHSDPYLALLDFRNTPTEGYGLSPAQRLFGRRTRTKFPSSSKLLSVPGARKNMTSQKQAKGIQQRYYNKGSRQKAAVPVQQTVRAKLNESSGWVKAEVVERLPYRSYKIETETGATYRRNRKHIRITNEPPIIRANAEPEVNLEPTRSQELVPAADAAATLAGRNTIETPLQRRTRSGRVVKQPAWMKDFSS